MRVRVSNAIIHVHCIKIFILVFFNNKTLSLHLTKTTWSTQFTQFNWAMHDKSTIAKVVEKIMPVSLLSCDNHLRSFWKLKNLPWAWCQNWLFWILFVEYIKCNRQTRNKHIVYYYMYISGISGLNHFKLIAILDAGVQRTHINCHHQGNKMFHGMSINRKQSINSIK